MDDLGDLSRALLNSNLDRDFEHGYPLLSIPGQEVVSPSLYLLPDTSPQPNMPSS